MTDRPRLVLHIGAGKCGSSAIQQFLVVNAESLADDGFLVPGRYLEPKPEGCGQHLAYFEDGIASPGFGDDLMAKLTALHDHAVEHDFGAVILSAENLINPKGFVDLFVPARELFDITVVAYVRRQDDFVISAWQQWQIKQHDDFWEYYGRHRGGVNWHRQLEPWRRNYGRPAVVVRRYSPDALVGGDVVADFCAVIEADLSRHRRPDRANRSLHERFNPMIARYRRELFTSIHDNRFYTFLGDVLGEHAYRGYRGSTVLTLSERRMVMADHAAANDLLKAEYFPELGEAPLFPPPGPADVHVSSEPLMDEATALSFLAMFRLWERRDG
ncbi:MAG: hypothetical protein OEZ14_00610 [Acidimicrobiia bacterium]|nr:hypothetical protein [Acidimicrobiia bacterium]MDH5519009.1 hypothetical protein [Acidimicrobiia bacterium]